MPALLLVGCGGSDDDSTDSTSAENTAGDGGDAVALMQERLDEIADHVSVWPSSDDPAEVMAAAEAAANLVVGPNGPDYGDRDGDGEIAGATEAGLLPGIDGSPDGVASPLAVQSCVARDVLAGTVDDPAAAWAEMESAIAAWTPSDNTMPTLASHPMRIVGWATFALSSGDFDEAHEFAGHAQLHVDVSQRALAC